MLNLMIISVPFVISMELFLKLNVSTISIFNAWRTPLKINSYKIDA